MKMNSTQTLEEFLTDTANEFPKLKTLRSRLLEIRNKVVQDADEQEALKVNYFKGKSIKIQVKDIVIIKITLHNRRSNCYNCGRQGHMAKNC